MSEKAPERCFKCEHCEKDSHLEYFPYYVCTEAHREISFNAENGYDRMNWCPLADDKSKE